MQFHQLRRKHKNKRSVPVGRGGKRGKTSGRGGKGQTARAGHKIYPQLRDVIRRIPKLRGRGRHGLKSFREKPLPIGLSVLIKAFPQGTSITPEKLLEAGLIARRSGKLPAVKILGGSAVGANFTLSGVAASASARAAIEKAGGTIS